ncbi:MAG: prepilin-type N-terminal cleavage/methylation domain-containing protein [Cyanobacteria bacterium SID2]|nr:prepilin-type N-terminal cleavage/methylation domain-containing protein [Cyanobacteria bacterium SID2]MBP0003661.1 prepilin-type N-terminal cleavage/methylation domain-containing protein [Cyanobacteria bacterium SBC]
MNISRLASNESSRSDSGFTLTELLVTIVIIGILASITLPSMMKWVSKAKEAESVQNIGAVTRAQLARRHEYSTFTDSLEVLEVGLSSETSYYTYQITIDDPNRAVTHQALPKLPELRAAIGAISVSNGVASMQLCQAEEPVISSGVTGAESAVFSPGNPPECPPGYQPL